MRTWLDLLELQLQAVISHTTMGARDSGPLEECSLTAESSFQDRGPIFAEFFLLLLCGFEGLNSSHQDLLA